MDICDEIKEARGCEGVHCSIIESKSTTLAELAARFGLIFLPHTYRAISKSQATAVAKRVLHRGLAYRTEIMPSSKAAALAKRFLDCFYEESTCYYTNGDYYCDKRCHSWTAATAATFDTGILVIGSSRMGCLWVEQEN